MARFTVTEKDKESITQLLSNLEELKKKHGRSLRIIDFPSFYNLINKNEQAVIEKYLEIDPRQFGFNGEYLGIVDVPAELIEVSGQEYLDKGEKKVISTQFVPKHVFQAYQKLNAAIVAAIGSPLLIGSAYRSPAYQMLVLFQYLQMNAFDLPKTLQRVALPGYSEHVFSPVQAIDFMTIEGVPSDEEPLLFAETEEYQWLMDHANRFKFYLSYPKNNKQGVMYEPWHWHYEE